MAHSAKRDDERNAAIGREGWVRHMAALALPVERGAPVWSTWGEPGDSRRGVSDTHL
jgi:hypothetical protein